MSHSICHDQQYATIFNKIDSEIERIKIYQTSSLAQELAERQERSPNFTMTDNEFLQICIELIAYIGAKSKIVRKLIDRGVFQRIFGEYYLSDVAKMDPDEIEKQYWKQIGCIRYKSKIKKMIDCAKVLLRIQEKHQPFMRFLQEMNIPLTINSQADIDLFWKKFGELQKQLNQVEMPFFSKLTTLCHLLTRLGYPCVGPNSAMNMEVKLEIIPSKKNIQTKRKKQYSDKEKKTMVKTMQVYSLCRQMKAPLIDLYLLIYDRQDWAEQFVTPDYYN